MPIKHVPRDLGDILRFFDYDFPQSHARYENGFVYYKSDEKPSLRIMSVLGIGVGSLAFIRLESSYQGRNDRAFLTVFPGGEMKISVSTCQREGTFDRYSDYIYPCCGTEEELFQSSLLHDMKNSTIEEHQYLTQLFIHYNNRSLEAYEKWKSKHAYI